MAARGPDYFDGSVATTYGRKVQLVVCDNTHAVAMSERGQQIKVRHSRHSHVKLADAREALALVHTIAEDFAREVAQLTSVAVSDGDWARFVDELAPLPGEGGRARTLAQTKREALQRLWDHDTRVAPWRGTAFGAMQAVNTFAHHESIVRGMGRSERNMLRAATGEIDALDRRSVEAILQIAA